MGVFYAIIWLLTLPPVYFVSFIATGIKLLNRAVLDQTAKKESEETEAIFFQY